MRFTTFFPSCVLAFVLIVGGSAQTRGESPSAIDPADIPVEKIMCQRLGIPNFFRKINQRSTNITIAYLGGSITAGAGASNEQMSYRARVTSYIRSKLPDSEVKEINAGLGGTGSFLGAFRVKRDCMNANPDLVFIEFPGNDAGETEKQCVAYLEGIVRQIWTSNPECDIVLIYTATENWFNVYKAGDKPGGVKAHEKVADYYGIPSINVGIAASMMVESKKWDSKDFSLDGVHPTDAGYALYADMIVKSGEAALSQWKPDSPLLHQRAPLPGPISMLPIEPGNLIPAYKSYCG
jgi:lysophospholipase L1-like esterase